MVKKVIRGHALSTTTQHKKLKSGNSVQGYKKHVGRGNASNFQALSRQNKREFGNDYAKTDTVSSDGEDESNIEGLRQAGVFYKSDDEEDSNSNSSNDDGSEDDKLLTAGTSRETNGMTQEETLKTAENSPSYNNIVAQKESCMDEEKQGLDDYVQSLSSQGRVATMKENKQLIKGVLPALFGACKFLQSDDDLFFNGTISRYFFHHLNIGEDKQELWWNECKNIVRKAIDTKRSSIGLAIRHEFMSKYNAKLYQLLDAFVTF